jgi:uncharacterized protein YycO
MFLIYDPGSYLVTGEKCRVILDVIKPGDVLLRGYDHYLDSFFIPTGKSKCSHSGIYIGENMVVHSIAEGVKCEDVLNFIRADRVVVLRPRVDADEVLKAIVRAKDRIGKKYDFNFEIADTEDSNPTNDKYFCHEFTKSCYPGIKIEKMVGKAKFLGLTSSPIYLADSFYMNAQFERVYRSWSNSKDMNEFID